MSNYAQINDFSAKDALPTGDPEKKIEGSDIDAELGAISAAIASKYDSGNIATEAEAEALALNTVLLTPLRLENVLNNNGGLLKSIGSQAAPASARMLQISDAGVSSYVLPQKGLEMVGSELRIASTAAGYGISYSDGVLAFRPNELNTVVGMNDNDYVVIEDTGTDQARRILWPDFEAALSITESQISDLGTYIEAGDTVSALTITNLTSSAIAVTTVNLGQNTDTSLTRRAAGDIQVEGKTVARHQNSTYDSCQVWVNTAAPTTQGLNGDLWFQYTL